MTRYEIILKRTVELEAASMDEAIEMATDDRELGDEEIEDTNEIEPEETEHYEHCD